MPPFPSAPAAPEAGSTQKTVRFPNAGRSGRSEDVTAGRNCPVDVPTVSVPGPCLDEGGAGDETVMADAVATALDSLVVLERHAREVAASFRWHRAAEGNEQLARLVDASRTLFRLAVVSATVAGADLQRLCAPGGPWTTALHRTRVVVDALIERQFATDWIAVSETLEEDFPAALHNWRAVFEALQPAAPAEGPQGHAA